MKKLAAAALLLMLALCALTPAGAEMNKYSAMYMDSFDTVIKLIAYAESEETFNAWSDTVHQTYLYLHKLFDTYNTYDDEGIVSVCALNQRAAQEPVEVDPILFSLLTYCKNNYVSCQGQVNVAMGSVLSIWHEYREAGLDDPQHASVPPMELLTAASDHSDIGDLILDEEAMTVYFADPELKLDLGAVAKGYATEIVAQLLLSSDLTVDEEALTVYLANLNLKLDLNTVARGNPESVAQLLLSGGMRSFIISAGGNVRVGEPPQDGRKAWGIGIQDPDGNVLGVGDIVETLFLSGMSVVTSGDYQRYYVVDGECYHHLIDPDTLTPPSYYRSVSIITENSGYADMLSTAAFLMPYDESRAFIDSLDGVEAIWLIKDENEDKSEDKDEDEKLIVEMTEGAKAWAKSFGATSE
ncbi:MAG: FAD:protein FMN transferase [Clostridiales bacterium]|nr:FAD:protein FMN transferase [Clostridiales bacterium]MDY5514030.1 FAD:protein FMN transferase [Candidatus Ventricola sp.]